MSRDTLIRDTLLYIIIVLVSYGATTLATNFIYGVVSLLLGAGLTIIRTIMKKY